MMVKNLLNFFRMQLRNLKLFKFSIILLLVFTISTNLLAQSNRVNKIIVSVAGEGYTLKDISVFANAAELPFVESNGQSAENMDTILKFALTKIIPYEAELQNIRMSDNDLTSMISSSGADISAVLAQAKTKGLSEEEYFNLLRVEALRTRLISKLIQSNTNLSDDSENEHYSHLELLTLKSSTKEEVLQAYKYLQHNIESNELYKLKDLGFVKTKELIPEISSQISKTTPPKVLKPIKSGDNYLIYKFVEEKGDKLRNNSVENDDDAKKLIENYLKKELPQKYNLQIENF